MAAEARSRTADILSIYVPAFFIFLGMGIVSPILAIYAETFNVTYALVSFAISMYAIGRFLADIPVGILADRYGRKPLMIGGTVLLIISSFLNATAVEYCQFLAYRLLEGVGAAMWITSRQALLADILRPEERGRVLSYFSSFMLIGSAAGPTVGGLVASTWSIRAPFYIYTVVSIISLILTIIFIKETNVTHAVHNTGGSGFSIAAAKKILSKKNFIMASVATFTMFFLTAGVRDMIIPLYASNVVGLDEASIGYILSFATVINLFLTIPIGYMIDSQGRKSVILKSLFVTSGACLVFSFTNSFWTMAAAAIVLGIGTSGAQQAPQAMATDVTIDDPHGLSMGLYRVFGDVGFIVGPTILGFLADRFGLTVPFYFMAALLFINGILVMKIATETFASKKMKQKQTPPG
ncbi:MAG: MFS transporter [Candidatus Bathyarchaeota archaeon]|nr:MFS transporter [Candidatus Bathyarchaeota archaeon]